MVWVYLVKNYHELRKKFFKGKSSKSKNGLGLSISDEIMKLHGGELLIDSIYGEWTKVTFSFTYG